MADETAAADFAVRLDLVELNGAQVSGASLAAGEGRVQRTPEGVVHLMSRRLTDRSADLRLLSGNGLVTLSSRADEAAHAPLERSVALALASRDFR